MTSFETKRDEERLFIQVRNSYDYIFQYSIFLTLKLVMVWQLLGGGKEALQNTSKMQESVPAQEFFETLRNKGYFLPTVPIV